jgi:nucleotide-binding universal stress UspA family protein
MPCTPSEEDEVFQRVLVAWDGSELAEQALDMAVDLARTYDAEIVAASVLGPGVDGHALDTAFASAREQRCAGVAVEHRVISGRHPAADLLDFAHEHGFDLLVIGHHRGKVPGRLLLHGVTEHLVSACRLPVLVVGSPRPDAVA